MDTDTKLMNAAIANQVRIELAERGMDQRALAEAIRIERSTLNRYLMGHVSMTMPTFFKLAEALGVAPSLLLGRAQGRLAAAPSGQDPLTGNG